MDALQQFWEHRFVSTHGAVVTGADAAKRIGCSYEIVNGLINSGKLKGRKAGSTWFIDEDSVNSFRSDFMPISLLAEMHFTSSRRIKQVCLRKCIPLLEIPLRERRAKLFSSSTDAGKISALLASKRPVHMVSTDEADYIASDTRDTSSLPSYLSLSDHGRG